MHKSNPVLAPDNIYERTEELETPYMPRGFPDAAATSEELDTYWRSLDKVASIWPEYDSIRDIDVRTLRPPVRQTLQQILKRISEQHELIRNLSEGQHESRLELTELREERDANHQLLKRRDHELKSLKEDVFLLRAELKKRGTEPRLPRQAVDDYSGREHSGSNSPQQGTPDHTRRFKSDSAAEPMHNGYDPEYENRKRFQRRERDGIFKATPLLLAEGSRAESKRVVQRTNSLKPIQGEGRNNYKDPPADQGDLRDMLWRAEIALEKEKKDNEILRDRLNISPLESSMSSISSLRPKRNISMEEYRERYHQLEALSLGKVAKCLSNQLSHTTEKRQQQFSCAVIQKAYDTALNTVKQFKDLIKALINNPANAIIHGDSGNYKQSGALAGQISLFEHFKPGFGINHMSKLAKKTQVAEEFPEELTKQIYDFLDSMADVTNIMDLVETVVDELRNEYGDCTTASLLNKAEFSEFLHDCCRLSWQITVIKQPLHVSSTEYMRYDEHYHVTDIKGGATNAKIDYYSFPILFSKKNSGEVLYKGRVLVKT